MTPSFTPHPESLQRIERWTQDPAVIGVVQVGSRTRGHGDASSDDDLEVVLTETAFAKLAPADCHDALIVGEGPARRIVYDAQLLALPQYEAQVGSAADLHHWPYERAVVHHDPTGRVAAAVRELAVMPEQFRRARLMHGGIDAMTALARAAKTGPRGWPAAAALVTARAARALTRVVFALERRWAPLDHWWEAELRTLADPAGVTPLLVAGVSALDPAPLREAFEKLGPALVAEGFPPDRDGRVGLFLTLVHASNAAERSRHGID